MANNFSDTLLSAIDRAGESVEKSIHNDWKLSKTRETREAYHAEQRVLSRLIKKVKREIRDYE